MTAKPIPKVTEMNRLYFEGCAKGELRLRRCGQCQARFRFAHEWCPKCWSLELEWVKASGLGKVSHYSIVYQPPSDAFEAPYVLALIDLDEGVRMMSNVKCDPEEVRIGLPVKVMFERRGEISLPVFVPLR
jgi:uncharacterized OB-fold protein